MKPVDKTTDETPFNPLHKLTLGQTVAEQLLKQELTPLGMLKLFYGAGIYVIYYNGDFPAYRLLSTAFDSGKQVPIYIGSAVPPGTRKGASLTETKKTRALYSRLQQHAQSIVFCNNLDIEHFVCRALSVDDIWIPLGEAVLIQSFKPLWNNRLGGFGNHDVGVRRHAGECTLWDTVHPGRPWAINLTKNPRNEKDIVDELKKYLKNYFANISE